MKSKLWKNLHHVQRQIVKINSYVNYYQKVLIKIISNIIITSTPAIIWVYPCSTFISLNNCMAYTIIYDVISTWVIQVIELDQIVPIIFILNATDYMSVN